MVTLPAYYWAFCCRCALCEREPALLRRSMFCLLNIKGGAYVLFLIAAQRVLTQTHLPPSNREKLKTLGLAYYSTSYACQHFGKRS